MNSIIFQYSMAVQQHSTGEVVLLSCAPCDAAAYFKSRIDRWPRKNATFVIVNFFKINTLKLNSVIDHIHFRIERSFPTKCHHGVRFKAKRLDTTAIFLR